MAHRGRDRLTEGEVREVKWITIADLGGQNGINHSGLFEGILQ